MSKRDRRDKAKNLLAAPVNSKAINNKLMGIGKTVINNAAKSKTMSNNPLSQRMNSMGRISALVGGIAGINAMPAGNQETQQDGKTEDFSSSQSVGDDANTGSDNVSSSDNTEGSIKVSIEPEEPKELTPTLNDMKSKSKNLSRMSEQGIVNEQTGAAVVVRTDGQINLAASKYSSYKLSPKGKVTEQSMESEKITNRMRLLTDEIIINEHKMNPQLWELTDFRESPLLSNKHALIGGFTLDGHVLVKAWEPQLKRYMLIRRPWRGPMFGPILNVPEINTAIRVDDPLKINDDILALSDKGYQVSTAIKDSKSLVGKAGQDRSGIPRNVDAMEGTDSGNGSSGGSSSGGSSSSPFKWDPSMEVGEDEKHCKKANGAGKGVDNIPSDANPNYVAFAKAASEGSGLPADWIYAQLIAESGGNEDDRYPYNYGNIRSVEGPWMSYASPEDAGHYFGKYIRLYNSPPCTAAHTLGEYIWAIQHQSGSNNGDTPYECSDPEGYEAKVTAIGLNGPSTKL